MFKPNNFKKGISMALALSMAFSNSSVMTIASSAGDTNTVSVDEGISVYDASEIEAVYNGELAATGDTVQDAENAGVPAEETSEAVADTTTETEAETAATTEETTTQAATETVAAAAETTANAKEEAPSETLSWDNETVKITAARTDGSSFPAGTELEILDYDGLSGDASAFISTFTEEELDLITDLHGFSVIYVTADGEEYDPGEVLYNVSFTDAGFKDMIVKAYGYPVDMSSHEVINKADITVSESGVSASVTTSDKAFSLIASEEAEAVTAPVVTDAVENGSADDVAVDDTEALPVEEDTVPVVTDSVESDSAVEAPADDTEALPVEEDAVRGQSSSDTATVATGTAIAAAEGSPDDVLAVEEDKVEALGSLEGLAGFQWRSLSGLKAGSYTYSDIDGGAAADALYACNIFGAHLTQAAIDKVESMLSANGLRMSDAGEKDLASRMSSCACTAYCTTFGQGLAPGLSDLSFNWVKTRVILYNSTGASSNYDRLRIYAFWDGYGDDGWCQDFSFQVTYGVAPAVGYLKLVKRSDTDVFDADLKSYSLNADYGIYKKKSDAVAKNSNYVKKVTLKGTSSATATVTLAPGTYYLAEIDAKSKSTSHNNSLSVQPFTPGTDTDVCLITIGKGRTITKYFYDNGYYYKGLLLKKVDAADKSKPIEGAVFKVCAYTYNTRQKDDLLKTWYFKTGQNGEIYYDHRVKDYYLSSWNGNTSSSLWFRSTSGQANGNVYSYALPRCYLTFQEVYVPSPYVLDPTVYKSSTVITGGDAAYNTAENKLTLNVLVITNDKGKGIKLQKTSSCSALSEEMDAYYSLAGATYRIYSDADCTTRAKDLDGKTAADLVTDADGISNTVANLDYGTYYVKEVTAPKGFIKDTSKHTVVLSKTDSKEIYQVSVKDKPVNDPGDLEIKKANSETEEPVVGAVFKLCCYNGENATAPERVWYYKTIDKTGAIDLSLGKYRTSTTDPDYPSDYSYWTDASAGIIAFPVGKYTLQEVYTPSPYKLDSTVHTAHVVDNGDGTASWKFDDTGSNSLIFNADSVEANVTNEENTTIRTQAFDLSTNERIAMPSSESKIVDKVTCNRLMVGSTYKLYATLYDRDSGEELQIDGGFTEFTADEEDMVVDVNFTVDTSQMEGRTVVVFEELLRVMTDEKGEPFNEVKVAEHASINDEAQSVHYPSIGTTAKDAVSGTHYGVSGTDSTIIDTVSYKNLPYAGGCWYIFCATLVDKMTGDVVGTPVLKEVEPESADGSVDIEIKFEGDASGHDLVVFEEVYVGSLTENPNPDLTKLPKIAEHKDINDEGQTVKYPKIGTTAKDASTGDNVGTVCTGAAIIDTVAYENLVPDQSYTLKGVLMDKDTGAELLVNGSNVTSEVSFTPEVKDGSVDVEFKFDASELGGHSVVVFEQLYTKVSEDATEETKVATHEVITDEGQTVHFIGCETTASDGITGDHVGTVTEEASLVDIVKCTNMVPGKTYTVNGTLMVKGKDGSEAGPLLDADGTPITATKTFEAKQVNFDIELVFHFDSSLLAGETIVAFERLEHEGIEVASHTDINDEPQIVHVPKICTNAYDGSTNISEIIAKDERTVIDKVTYENLVPGETYTLEAVLMDKDTQEPLVVNDIAVTDSQTFTVESEDGSGEVEMSFTFDMTGLDGHTFVAFEQLYHNRVNVVSHEDFEDTEQTVVIPKIGTTAKDSVTGLDESCAEEQTITIVDTVAYEDRQIISA